MDDPGPGAEAQSGAAGMTPVSSFDADHIVIGGGIIGLAVARQLLLEWPGSAVVVLEKEPEVATHQTGRNSGVVHAGIYYPPGSQKATLTKRSIPLLRAFARDKGVPYLECGKLVIARSQLESARLADLLATASANGVPGLERVDASGIREREPAATGYAAIWSPTTAITDFVELARAIAADVAAMGGVVMTGYDVIDISSAPRRVTVATRRGATVTAGSVVICAGLESDRLALRAGDATDPVIVPFRGEYMRLVGESHSRVNGLIYPVPDPRYPFLGVHFTPTVHGDVLVGPNAVPATARYGYRRRDIDPRFVAGLLRRPGVWRLGARHWRRGLAEAWRSVSRRAYVRGLQEYVPSIRSQDLVPTRAGVRAQAVARNGDLLGDFVVTCVDRVVAVRNAPSPGATAALALAEDHVAKVPR